MKYTLFEKVLTVCLLIFCIGLAFLVIEQSTECAKEGKAYVRGVFWFECVKK